MAKVRFMERIRFSLLHSVQTDFGAHPASSPMDTRGTIPGDEAPGREADRLNLVPRSKMMEL
jgi:hypothetical protein